VRRLQPFRADVPASLEAVILRALSPVALDRFPTTDDFAAALTAELVQLGTMPTKPQIGDFMRTWCSAAYATQRQLLTRIAKAHVSNVDSDPPRAALATPSGEAAKTVLAAFDELEQAPAARSTNVTLAAGREPSPQPRPLGGSTDRLVAEFRPNSLKRAVGAGLVLLLVGVALGVAWTWMNRRTTPKAADVAPDSHGSPAGLGAPGVPGPRKVARAPAKPLNNKPAEAAADENRRLESPIADKGTAHETTLDAGSRAARDAASDSSLPVGRLTAVGRLTPNPAPTWIVTNTSSVTWSECTVYAPGRRQRQLSRLESGTSVELPVASFRIGAGPILGARLLQFRCAQGTLTIRAQ
jgi:hypothetical protein